MSKTRFFGYLLALCLVAAFASCDEKDNNLGIDLQDPSTIYNGTVDTAYGIAYTVFDDSLLTQGLNVAIIGGGTEPHFGSSEATLFTNVSTYKGGSATFDDKCRIDSVILSLAISGIYVSSQDSASVEDLHFIVRQLDERLKNDTSTNYYGDSEVGVSNTVFFDDVVSVQRSDSMVVHLKLSDAFTSLITNRSYANADEFEEAVKGMHISLVSNDVTKRYVTINLSASGTRLTAYYSYDNEGTWAPRVYDFDFGTNITHFSHFERTFIESLTTFNTNHNDSVRGGGELFLSPLGGTNIKFNMDAFVRQFHQNHPLAIIHYAELIMPLSANASTDRPSSIAALKMFDNGLVSNIPDMYDPVTYGGFDGKYDAANNCYRLRITQHFQDLIRTGKDYGTVLVISSRRTSCEHTIINGDDAAANPIRVRFVYSE